MKTTSRSPRKSLEEYLAIRYPFLIEDDGGNFLASNPDLPGCMAEAPTIDEAIAALDRARRLWIKTQIEDGLDVPEPTDEEFSGKTIVRMSSSLHGTLARLAREQGVSLNHLMVEALSSHAARAVSNKQFAGVQEQLSRLREAIQGLSQNRFIETMGTSNLGIQVALPSSPPYDYLGASLGQSWVVSFKESETKAARVLQGQFGDKQKATG